MATQIIWSPQEHGLKEICSLLQEHRTPSADQAHIFLQLQQLTLLPDFNNYLAFILCHGEGQPVEVRQVAGLLLKNSLKVNYETLIPAYVEYIKDELLLCLGSSDRHIRATVGTVTSVIVEQGRVKGWPQLLRALLHCLDSNDYNHAEGALDALSKICEDSPLELDVDVPGLSEKPINVFLPRLLKMFSSPHATIRKLALTSVNQFIAIMPEALFVNMDNYLQGLFSLAHDSTADVRKLVCAALVKLLEVNASYLQPHIRSVIEYMLQANKDSDAEVALEACEFWTTFCEARLPPELLRDCLPRLIGILLSNMVYADDDEAVLDAEDDESVPDRDEDIKPRFKQLRLHGSIEEDDEEEDDDDDIVNSWTLRKCSAAGLDVMSSFFGDEMLPILMPKLQVNLESKEDSHWKEREAAVLALGAIAEGCVNGLLPHLFQIFTFLLPLLDDKFPLVRSITCWTLSRYSKWIVQDAVHPEGCIWFDNLLTGLLHRILDNNKRVQEAACSAFATLEEEAAEELAPRLDIILQHLMYAFSKYQMTVGLTCQNVKHNELIPAMIKRRNLRILYDAIGTLADAVGADLNEAKHLNVLMPPLIAKWQQLKDSDKDLFPLLECFTSLAQALGPAFAQYAEPVFARCINLIQTQGIAKADPGRAGVAYDKEFIICSLDLLSGLAEGLGSSIESLVGRSNLNELLIQCCNDEAPDVRQSALALLGDLAKACSVHLQPRLPDLLTVAVKQLGLEVRENVSVANNACWAIGEVAVKVRQEISPIALNVISYLVPILSNAEVRNKSLIENCAITLGRLGWVCPQQVAPHLEHFVQPWCQALSQIRDDIEKEDAFRGLCAMVKLNPTGAIGSFSVICEAIGSWHEIHSVDLQNEICQVLHGYKQMIGRSWEQCVTGIDSALREKLSANYGV